MTAVSTAISLDRSKAYRAILLGGLTAGILDITAAFINSARFGRSPMWVLQSVASGLLGADSYTGGLRAAALGVVVHFSIALVACAVYYAASRKVEVLVQHAVVCGLLYGIAVYSFMYLVVLPLTFHRTFVHPLSAVITGLVIHMLCVGLPISLIISRYSKTIATNE
jgi:uncharacterized membrane protein YagU involved in acid resistance